MKLSVRPNDSPKSILLNMLLAFVSLFLNGFGVYLTINANIGAGPWDVFNLGLSKTFGIIYGNASISVSIAILLIDIAMHEPIGIAMFIDAVTVGKAVDFFNYLNLIPKPETTVGGIVMMFIGLVILNVTLLFYMLASLGCGPRDTLLVGLKRRIHRLPIGILCVIIHALATFIGFLLGGPVGIGTLIFAFTNGPILQIVFNIFHFDATKITHQSLFESLKIFLSIC